MLLEVYMKYLHPGIHISLCFVTNNKQIKQMFLNPVECGKY